ncbi:MAG: hypothetical protein A2Z74_06805 [Chloroflexi bacterium RBG_13_46_9]|jgi:hypothetical protein|nr:MAG: hypothetical protein A2Z74_06805 [Chloroflexi bacterium RBG_13_46_9]
MPTEDEIKELAYRIWEEEGRPEGKDVENYYRAVKILGEQEAARSPALIKAPPTVAQLPPASPPTPQKSQVSGRVTKAGARKKKGSSAG